MTRTGDFDEDGAEDILLGAPGADAERGIAYFLYGNQAFDGVVPLVFAGTCDVQGWQLQGAEEGSRLGFDLGGRGDLNLDGAGDVIIGAPGNFPKGIAEGHAYIIFGDPSSPPITIGGVRTRP